MKPRDLLTRLLDYIGEQAKDINPRAYRLANAKGFLKRRADLAGLPGVEFDLNVQGDHLWLRVQRLQAYKPPALDEKFKGFIRVSDDPNGAKPAIDEGAIKARIKAAAAGKTPEERVELERRGRAVLEQALAQYLPLVERGYRVIPQVQTGAYRIDMVVEGAGDVRLAIECDGDEFHGPDRWPHDMARQRVLERAGWTFWRCFASTWHLHKDEVLAELIERLATIGIEPLGAVERAPQMVEKRVVGAADIQPAAVHALYPSGAWESTSSFRLLEAEGRDTP